MYIIQSQKSGQYYTGSSASLADRLQRHNANRTLATKGRGPWVLVYAEEFNTRSEAVRRELEVKSWKSSEAIRRLIEET